MRRANSANLFIANLPPKMHAEELAELFDVFGHVLTARLTYDTRTGAPRGYGFVDLAPAAAVDRAIEQLNGRRIDGRAIVVGRTRPPRPAQRPSASNRAGARVSRKPASAHHGLPRIAQQAARPVIVVYKSRSRHS